MPEAVGGAGRRGARLGVHGNQAAMKVRGLEGALVSHARRGINSLTPDADRSCVLKVAGPAALLVSKVHKIGERLEDRNPRRRDRLAKDALDIYRLLRAVETAEMAAEFDLLGSQEVSSGVTADALVMFRDLFGAPSGTGIELVVRAAQGVEDTGFITASSVALSQDLLEATSDK